MPIYGRAFESTNGIRQSFNGIGPGTWEAGVYDYKALPMAGATVTENTAEGASYSYDSSKKELKALRRRRSSVSPYERPRVRVYLDAQTDGLISCVFIFIQPEV